MTLNRIAISLFIVQIFAFPAGATAVSLKELTQKLKFYSQLKTFETNFTQVKSFKDLEMKLKSKGKLSVERPHRVNWTIYEPAPVSVLIDQDKVEIKSGSGSDAQTQVFKMSEMGAQDGFSSLANVTNWMKLDADQLFKDYDVTTVTKDTYIFVPKNKAESLFMSLEMVIAKSGHLKSLKIAEKSGDRLDIQFSETKSTSLKNKTVK